jgi:hypothetical protein
MAGLIIPTKTLASTPALGTYPLWAVKCGVTVRCGVEVEGWTVPLPEGLHAMVEGARRAGMGLWDMVGS